MEYDRHGFDVPHFHHEIHDCKVCSFDDVGVVNCLAKRGTVNYGSEFFGKAFENWLFHELSVYSKYSESFYDISYWRLTTGVEVDFILGDARLAIEAKAKEKVTSNDFKGLLEFKKEYKQVEHLIIVSLEKKSPENR